MLACLPQVAQGGVDETGSATGLQRGPLLEGPQVPIGAQVTFLHGILGVARRSGDPQGNVVESPAVLMDHLPVGVAIAPLQAADQVRACSSMCLSSVRSTPIDASWLAVGLLLLATKC